MDGPGDAVWILTSAFIIFTMISGFGLVESGKCNLTNIQATFQLFFSLGNCLALNEPVYLLFFFFFSNNIVFLFT